jgi:peptidyl-prolyl cis-trans isomerase B (cyclophilin B)
MTYGGYGGGPADPFGGDPFGAAPSGSQGFPAANQGYGANHGFPSNQSYPPLTPPPDGEVNTLSTLSIVFAVIFAPAGAALGHVALHQIRQRGQRGRERALIGLTLSYVIIVVAIIALVIWLLSGNGSPDTPAVVSATPTTTTTTRPAPPPPPRTTVITAPPTERPTVTVEELHVGDCVEVKQNEPIPGKPTSDYIAIYRAACEVRDGILQVTQIVTNESDCTTYMLFNHEETLFACTSDFKG